MNPRKPEMADPVAETPKEVGDGPDSGISEAEGDFGGAYGYGHPAHKPDPTASYGFDPGRTRPLPANPKLRWR